MFENGKSNCENQNEILFWKMFKISVDSFSRWYLCSSSGVINIKHIHINIYAIWWLLITSAEIQMKIMPSYYIYIFTWFLNIPKFHIRSFLCDTDFYAYDKRSNKINDFNVLTPVVCNSKSTKTIFSLLLYSFTCHVFKIRWN